MKSWRILPSKFNFYISRDLISNLEPLITKLFSWRDIKTTKLSNFAAAKKLLEDIPLKKGEIFLLHISSLDLWISWSYFGTSYLFKAFDNFSEIDSSMMIS